MKSSDYSGHANVHDLHPAARNMPGNSSNVRNISIRLNHLSFLMKKQMKNKRFKAVELFAGAGGLALGVSRGGFDHALILERDRLSCNTLEMNFDQMVECVDIRDFNYANLGGAIDFVAGGPPCQPFSVGGKAAASFDPRDMFPETIRAIRHLKPKAFLFENVKGLIRRGFANYLEYIRLQLRYPDIEKNKGETTDDHFKRLERYETSGANSLCRYNIVIQCLNAADFGVPQIRERVFIVGFRDDVGAKWAFPEPTHSQASLKYTQLCSGEYWEKHSIFPPEGYEMSETKRPIPLSQPASNSLPWITVRDALMDLPAAKTNSSSSRCIKNHIFVPGAKQYKGHTGSSYDAPSKTLKAGVHGVPGGENMLRTADNLVRYFTVRECARLQTFPDSYAFEGSWGAAVRQIGNAVPPILAEQLARSIAKVL